MTPAGHSQPLPAGMSQRRDPEEGTEGDAPAQDLTTPAGKDSVPQADSCSCALPHPACSLLIPQGCAACLQLPRESPQASEFTQTPCCCPMRQCPGGSRAAAGAGLAPGSTWEELSWQDREHSPGHPYPWGIFLGVSCSLALPVLPGCAGSSPHVHTPCVPGCARLPLLPPQRPGSCLLVTFPAGQDAPGASACGHLPPWQLLQTAPAVSNL